jgi:galactokinase/mevalonate kinase-like predicted kinase
VAEINKVSLLALSNNQRQSIFYQLDLKNTSDQFVKLKLPLPQMPGLTENIMTRIHYLMLCAAYYGKGSGKKAAGYKKLAFELLQDGLLENIRNVKLNPAPNVQCDQILWGRSPLRLDFSGGWTDTPPYCILYGGSVVNMAVELNGQPPVQVYVRPTSKPVIVIHSIDLGLTEEVKQYDDVSAKGKLGSAFSIPKAALRLAGFHPDYSEYPFQTLKEQLLSFGGGFEISLMVAVPKGSGLGTSSILAATILGALSEFCSLGWDRHEIACRTLLLEQLLTTGGGWQDQFGGIFSGVKLVESTPGLVQKPSVRWAPDHLFLRHETSALILLYYTGITRFAKHILTDIVEGMFLNSAPHLGILSEMKHHAANTYAAIQNNDWDGLTAAIGYSWELNQRLDSGTNTPEIAAILRQIKDLMSSCKLLGAGGGGYLMICARDLQAASRIRTILMHAPPNPRARFVDWKLSDTGLELTKS